MEEHLAQLLLALKLEAAEVVARNPQYQGHFEQYVLVKVQQPVRTKMGVAFTRGEVSIGRRQTTILPGCGSLHWTVWSRRNGIDTAVDPWMVEVLYG